METGKKKLGRPKKVKIENIKLPEPIGVSPDPVGESYAIKALAEALASLTWQNSDSVVRVRSIIKKEIAALVK